ncbi:methyltransferase family protein [Paramagnetospirillum caucaseum]|uniref:Methyltransferase family protein n=1 Tax=Paramagnetospirillum caucaseum TaxID=1244869 RepID=M3A647_9PROT|nr:class I SAM-dependent methyltransferase [Paramagnetospirillum caucaseum]EME67949.1 methyltransferase family protein [Paramagnetospirillum caucaseum]
MADISYPGEELLCFAEATNWKRYMGAVLSPHVGTSVLDVGAGLGETAKRLNAGTARRWVCLEPDRGMADGLDRSRRAGELGANCDIVHGTLADLPPDRTFDTILYIDVLEHIERDGDELANAAQYLQPGGRLIVLTPAFSWLFTEFDAAIGHFRRYSRPGLAALTPPNMALVEARYLDSVGLMTSLMNRFLLHAAKPTRSQIALWDKILVPISTVVDRCVGYSFGRSVICVWRKP